ncbi:unnamed protein product [Staurois parvus]|uniref:Uncharacterized protein n=1 Tax=Staurois parvus TaxID=386267 RepID=A0ABN9A976_9NEOB|nr:unnamed protein product [Staurois parvus]
MVQGCYFTRDILLTTLHVITDWPISDHMIGTSYRGPVRRSVFHCVQGARTSRVRGGHPTLHCHRPAVYMQQPVGKWLILSL